VKIERALQAAEELLATITESDPEGAAKLRDID